MARFVSFGEPQRGRVVLEPSDAAKRRRNSFDGSEDAPTGRQARAELSDPREAARQRELMPPPKLPPLKRQRRASVDGAVVSLSPADGNCRGGGSSSSMAGSPPAVSSDHPGSAALSPGRRRPALLRSGSGSPPAAALIPRAAAAARGADRVEEGFVEEGDEGQIQAGRGRGRSRKRRPAGHGDQSQSQEPDQEKRGEQPDDRRVPAPQHPQQKGGGRGSGGRGRKGHGKGHPRGRGNSSGQRPGHDRSGQRGRSGGLSAGLSEFESAGLEELLQRTSEHRATLTTGQSASAILRAIRLTGDGGLKLQTDSRFQALRSRLQEVILGAGVAGSTLRRPAPEELALAASAVSRLQPLDLELMRKIASEAPNGFAEASGSPRGFSPSSAGRLLVAFASIGLRMPGLLACAAKTVPSMDLNGPDEDVVVVEPPAVVKEELEESRASSAGG
ncbi:unnamed protein product, partial [Polarella glacialis]